MRISHVIKTDQIHSAPHFVMSLFTVHMYQCVVCHWLVSNSSPHSLQYSLSLHFCSFYPCDAMLVRSLLRQRGWVSVTHRYCVWTAKSILKLFSTNLVAYASTITLVFWPLRWYPIPREPFSRVENTWGWEKLATFDGNRRLSRKRCEISPWLLWNVNRKSWVPDRMVSFSMTLSAPIPGFKVTVYLQVKYLKKVRFRGKVTKEHY